MDSVLNYATNFMLKMHPKQNFPPWVNYELFMNEKLQYFIQNLRTNILNGEYSIYEYSDVIIGYNGLAFIDSDYEYKISQSIDALFHSDTSIHEYGLVPKKIIELIINEREKENMDSLFCNLDNLTI